MLLTITGFAVAAVSVVYGIWSGALRARTVEERRNRGQFFVSTGVGLALAVAGLIIQYGPGGQEEPEQVIPVFSYPRTESAPQDEAPDAATLNNFAGNTTALRLTTTEQVDRCPECWATTAEASVGETIWASFYYENTGGQTADDVFIRLYPSEGAQDDTGVVIRGYVWAGNAPLYDETVVISVPGSTTVRLDWEAAYWYPERSTSEPASLDSAILRRSGASLGDVRPGPLSAGMVVVKFAIVEQGS